MHIIEFEDRIEVQLSEAVRRHFPLDWDENGITHDLIIRLRESLARVTVFGGPYPIEVEWEAYKFRGRRESSYGDIGLLFRYRLPAARTIEGAGFLEAKVRGRDSTRFHQVRREQVSRLLSRSPQTRLMLYDYNPVAVLPIEDRLGPEWGWYAHPRHDRPSLSHGPVLPLELAAAVNTYDDTLYRFAHSFSHQFCRRYLHLHDLDFRDQAIAAVKGFPADIGSPTIVLVVRVAPTGQELPEPFSPNDNLYGPLE